MDTKWKKWKGAVSFTAFFLAVNLLAAGAFLAAMVPLGGYAVRDVLEPDYQNTQAFRDLISANLDALIALTENDGAEILLPMWGGLASADAATALSVLAPDKNLLYKISTLYGEGTQTNGLSGGSRQDLPPGYNFYLHYFGQRLRVWKDGEEVDVYRSGSGWRIPAKRDGSENSGKYFAVALAVADSPVQYAVPGGGSPLYGLSRDLSVGRTRLTMGAALAAAGLALLALGMAWRAERLRVRAAIAACTGKVWLELKLLLLSAAWVALVTLLPSRSPSVLLDHVINFARNFDRNAEIAAMAAAAFCGWWLLYFLWGDLRYNRVPWRTSLVAKLCADGRTPKASNLNTWLAARTGKVWIELKISILLFSPKVIFSATAANMVNRFFSMLNLQWVAPAFVLLRLPILLAVVYLIVNDLRLNRGQFQHGLVAYFQKTLCASEEKYSIRARLTRRTWVSLLCVSPFVVLGTLFSAIMVINAWDSSAQYRIFLILIPITCLALLSLLAWLFLRFLTTARDVGALADQITAVRAGELTKDLALPKDADLVDLSAALGDIRSGMRAAMEEQLRSERMRVELIANVSHDLKTPLTSVVSYAELLKQEEDLPDHVKDYINILNDKAGRLKVMIQDVFEVSKAASGELRLKVERLDLGKLLRQTLADMSDPIAESGLVFRTDLPAEAVYIHADGSRLYRVFQNLIQNALQYSLDGSRVYIALRLEDGCAVAEVKNTSRAELPADVDLAARFVRGDESRTGEGSGLGLAIASSFTASCGGRFEVTTNADLFTATVGFPVAQ